MKLCYFSCSALYGGVEKIIVDSLNEIVKKYECALIVPLGCTYKEKLSSDVAIIEYKSYDKRYNPFLYLEVYKILKSYDIVHTHGAKATQITYILNKFLSFIHIATKHNIRKGEIFNKIKNVISVSNEVSKTITHPTKVIYFGISSNNSLIITKNERFTILAVGRLDTIKGFDKLIIEVAKLSFDFQLNIIGDGKQRARLEELISSNNLTEKVFLHGFKNNIPQYLANSHLQVISSLSEGLPLTLLEGIMNSSVIISTPVGGIAEVLDENYLVYIDQFANKITNIYKNYEFYSKDFKSKHAHLKQKFNFHDYSQNLEHYYKRCIHE